MVESIQTTICSVNYKIYKYINDLYKLAKLSLKLLLRIEVRNQLKRTVSKEKRESATQTGKP